MGYLPKYFIPYGDSPLSCTVRANSIASSPPAFHLHFHILNKLSSRASRENVRTRVLSTKNLCARVWRISFELQSYLQAVIQSFENYLRPIVTSPSYEPESNKSYEPEFLNRLGIRVSSTNRVSRTSCEPEFPLQLVRQIFGKQIEHPVSGATEFL